MPGDSDNKNRDRVKQAVSERRRQMRFPCMVFAEAFEPISNAQVGGRTSDIGLGGCYVDTISPFPQGTAIRIRLKKDDESFEANAKVVYAQIGMGMGIAFTSAEKGQIRLYRKWVSDLGGDLQIEPDARQEEQENGEDGDDGSSNKELSYVVSELILALMRKGVLTEPEGKEMLRKLLR